MIAVVFDRSPVEPKKTEAVNLAIARRHVANPFQYLRCASVSDVYPTTGMASYCERVSIGHACCRRLTHISMHRWHLTSDDKLT